MTPILKLTMIKRYWSKQFVKKYHRNLMNLESFSSLIHTYPRSIIIFNLAAFFFRGAQCCYQLKRYPDCIKWSKKALELEANDNEIQAMLEKVTKEQKEFERNARRELTRKNKKSKEELKLLKGLKSRGVKLQEVDLNRIDLDKEEHVVEVIEKLTPILPAAFKQKVHFR